MKHLRWTALVILAASSLAPQANAQEPLRVVSVLGQSTPPSSWWDESMGGWIGGIGGSLIGILGALIGTLTALGRGRTLVFGLLYFMIALGACGIVAGIVALIQKQPYGVWYPLILGGALCLPLGLFLAPSIRKKFEAAELKRMQAMDGK